VCAHTLRVRRSTSKHSNKKIKEAEEEKRATEEIDLLPHLSLSLSLFFSECEERLSPP
jgi:hypothetical protein